MKTGPHTIAATAGIVLIIAAIGMTMRKTATQETGLETRKKTSARERLTSIKTEPSGAQYRSARRIKPQLKIVDRAARIAQSHEALLAGRIAYAEKDYQKAYDEYNKALSLLPPGSTLINRRHAYLDHLGDAAVSLAQNHRRVGKYTEARSILESFLRQDPSNLSAKQQLEYLDYPIRRSVALTYEHTQAVNRVRKLLYMGEGYYNLGEFDKAEKEFVKILQIDPYNKAARRWLEKASEVKSEYYRTSSDHTQTGLPKGADHAWE